MRRRSLLNDSSWIDPTTGRGMIGNYEVVDLGLSNGLLFATCNVWATEETNYGKYYKYGYGSFTYSSDQGYYQTDENPLASSADTATQVMGEGWRMPTLAELEDLISNTNNTWTAINGIEGAKLTSKTNPNAYVFFPASGHFHNGMNFDKGDNSFIWSSTPETYQIKYSYALECQGMQIHAGAKSRVIGCPVRGVHAAV